MTKSSRSIRVSRTRPRSPSVRRSRRSRVTGNVLSSYSLDSRRRSTTRCGVRRRDLLIPPNSLPWPADADRPLGGLPEPDVDRQHLHLVPRRQLDAFAEELPHRPAGRKQRQCHQRARQPIDLTAGEQAEDDEQRMEPQRVPHHVRDDDVTFDLMDRQEQQKNPDRRGRMDDERVQEWWNRTEPRSQIRNQFGDRNPRTEEQRVLLTAWKPSERTEQPQAHARA